MTKVQLIFDFDDTIVITNPEFEKTNLQCAEVVSEAVWGDLRGVQTILAYQRGLDLEMVKKLGLARPRFLMSWLSTYREFCRITKVAPTVATENLLTDVVNDVYVRDFELMPHALETLDSLRKEGYSLVILTAGEEEVQKRRVEMSGAKDFVDEVYVRNFKTPETLKEVIEWHPASEHVMIGNSLKSDIHPALSNDIWGFHYEQETWELDHYDIETSHPKYVHLGCLTEVSPNLIQRVSSKKSA